ncbi:hypothetical protein ACFHWW_13755 [Ensifer sp. P24N7]|uniref:hypothetical protein n=1 Tax=Sinorhizobium sp. P24N7 TaxID=3348358 RepID=UPI0035F42050
MNSIHARIQVIIEDLTELQEHPQRLRNGDDDFPFPRVIDAGNGGSLYVSGKIDDYIAKVADELLSLDTSLKPRFTTAEWRAMVRKSFGPALAQIDLDDDISENTTQVFAKVQERLKRDVNHHGIREYAFGCTLFGNSDVKPFSIGPVKFEDRETWLHRKTQERDISAVTRRRVIQSWNGKHLKKRRPSRSSIDETDVLQAFSESSFVSSILTEGLGSEAGRDKALTAARLAITGIALLWQTPSKALHGMNLLYDRGPRRQKTMSFIPGKAVLSGSSWSHMPHGPRLKSGEWEQKLQERQDHFQIIGEVLEYVVSPSGDVARPRVMNTLVQALLWFHEGCRETVALMAIVKFSSVLDALASGGKARGIREVITARVGIKDDQALWADGPTMKHAVDEIYSEGRSRTVHGTNMKIGHDWTSTRSIAEQLARLCLIMCIDWAAEATSSDDPLRLRS